MTAPSEGFWKWAFSFAMGLCMTVLGITAAALFSWAGVVDARSTEFFQLVTHQAKFEQEVVGHLTEIRLELTNIKTQLGVR